MVSWMDQVGNVSHQLKEYLGRYFFTLIALVLCSVLIVGVPQVRYAFELSGFAATVPHSVLTFVIFGLYYLLSAAN